MSTRPKCALFWLCVVQSCERFAFFAMLPLFVLYLHHRHGMSEPAALLVFGVFQALSYLGGLPGGWLADRKLRPLPATLLGAVLLACGYGMLALDRPMLLWPALLLMTLGHSLFKPGLHVSIGRLASDNQMERERGFLWHYLAINLGGLCGPLFAEWTHARYGWAALYLGATAASALGSGLLVVGARLLRACEATAGTSPSAPSSRLPAAGGMQAVWLICGVAVVFWLTAQQAGSSLVLFASSNTVQQVALFGLTVEIGPGHFASLHALLVLALLPAFLTMNARQSTRSSASAGGKMVVGYVVTSAAFALLAAGALCGGDSGRVSPAWLVGCYVLLSLAEMLLAPLGVSLLTHLAPRDKAAQAVGLWFAAIAAGNVLAGALGVAWDRWPHHRYFAALALLCLGAAGVLLIRLRHLEQLMTRTAVASRQPVTKPEREATSPPCAEASRQASAGGVERRFFLAALAILGPVPLILVQCITVPARAASAMLCGLTVLLCGSYLLGEAIDRAHLVSGKRPDAIKEFLPRI